jgi:excisionase family DNA binding protein
MARNRNTRSHKNPLTHPAQKAFEILGIGRDAGYGLIHAGRLRAIRVDKRMIVPQSEIEDFLKRELEEAAK